MNKEQIKIQLQKLENKDDYVCFSHENAKKYKKWLIELITELNLKAVKEKEWIVIKLKL